ncbi:MAG TPA: glutamate formimidoyltransferase [Chitinophagales bacterium]|nr:glutamate formimidoyltransferase [Chitinophagales bacterium]
MNLVECIPNFSEGRNPQIIQAIADAIQSVPNVWLLHIDTGHDAHRTVYTFVGDILTIGEAAFRAITTAHELINMEDHFGEHPRMGACDVCPFVPLGDTPMESIIQLTHDLGKRLGLENIPIYMYENSAQKPQRKNLAFLRKGEYEGLEGKLKLIEHLPDYGPVVFNKKFGAMVLGARPFLIAYNVNLESKDVGIAKKIAATIREKGYHDENGHHDGLLKGVKAIGWWMEEYQCAQVSTNIVDTQLSDVKDVFDAVRDEAKKYNIDVITSELIGLIPLDMILKAGRKITPKETNVEILQSIVFNYLGWRNIGEERIIEKVLDKLMKN